MSSVTRTSASSTATASCSLLYDPPVKDASCAMPYSEDNAARLLSCCNGAEVISYYDNCGLYCLAKDQKISDLSDCLYKDQKADWVDVFCRGSESASATGTGGVPASAEASVVKSADSTATKSSSKSSGTSTSSSTAKSSDNAAPSARQPSSVSTLGITIGALLLSSTVFGAVLL